MSNIITPEIETEAAIWAEGTRFSEQDIIKAYREHLRTASEPLDIQSFCEQVLGIDPNGEDTAIVTDVETNRHGVTTVKVDWLASGAEHTISDFDLEQAGDVKNWGGLGCCPTYGWVTVHGKAQVKKGDRLRLSNS